MSVVWITTCINSVQYGSTTDTQQTYAIRSSDGTAHHSGVMDWRNIPLYIDNNGNHRSDPRFDLSDHTYYPIFQEGDHNAKSYAECSYMGIPWEDGSMMNAYLTICPIDNYNDTPYSNYTAGICLNTANLNGDNYIQFFNFDGEVLARQKMPNADSDFEVELLFPSLQDIINLGVAEEDAERYLGGIQIKVVGQSTSVNEVLTATGQFVETNAQAIIGVTTDLLFPEKAAVGAVTKP